MRTTRHLAAGTDTGLVRKRNEDAAYAGRYLCAVADGMGGNPAGDVASATVIAALRRFDQDPGSPARLLPLLAEAIHAANDQIAAKIKSDGSAAGMATTLTALAWTGGSVAVGHIGDSRAYLLRHGALRQITEDHVLANLVAHPSPASTSGFVVRYLDGRPDRSPDLTLRSVAAGDRYLICSDGLSGVLEADVIREVLTSVQDPGQAVDDLIQLTLGAGARDNVTMIIADVAEGIWRPADRPVTVGAAAAVAEVT